MTKKLLTFLTLLCLSVGVGWAAEQTITLTQSSFGLTTPYAVKTATVGDFIFTIDKGYKSGNNIQMNSNQGNGVLYNNTAITGLKTIKVTIASGSKQYAVKTGTAANQCNTSVTNTSTATINVTSGHTYFRLEAVSGAIYISSIEITYEEASSTPTITASPSSLSFEAELEDTDTKTVTATCSNISGGITAMIETGDHFYINNGSNGNFTLSNNQASIEVVYYPTSAGNHTDNLLLYYGQTLLETVPLSGTATATVTPPSAPVFSPAGGTYNSAQTVTITADSGCNIYYTTNGVDPTVDLDGAEQEYTGPITISSTTTLKAIAVGANHNVSAVTSATYTITLANQLATPTFSLEDGEYYKGTTVNISYPTGSTLVYTIGETMESVTSPNPFTIVLDDDMEIEAYATQDGHTDSQVAKATYLLKSVPAPTFSPAAGAVTAGTTVTISSEAGTTLYGLIGEDEFTESSNTKTVTINEATEINAYAVKSVVYNGTTYTTKSEGATAAYTIQLPTGTITFGSASRSLNINRASVSGDDSLGNTWTVTTTGTTSFTPNSGYAQVGSGSNPATSITFTTTLPNNANVSSFKADFGGFNSTAGTVTLKVDDTTVGTGSLNGTSDVTVSSTSAAKGTVLTVTVTDIAKGVKCYSITYSYKEIIPSVATPTFTPAAGTYNEAKDVTITCATEGATIYYTTDGKTPTSSSTQYTAAIHVDETTTIKAIAVVGQDESAVATATYTIEIPTVETPTFTPSNGALTGATNVTISCATDGATIYYTTDGSTPTSSSTEYTAAIPVTKNTTIKAIGVKEGMINSDVSSIDYVITATEPASGTYYQKVTSTTNLADGEYLIVYEGGNVAFDGSLETLDAVSNTIAVTISNNKIESSTTVDAAVFTIEAITGGYSIQSASGKYIGKTATGNGMNTSDSEAYLNTIAIDVSENAVITSSGNPVLRFNDSSNQNRFRYYGSGQKAIQLYKKVSVTISEKELADLGVNDLNTFTKVSDDYMVVAKYDTSKGLLYAKDDNGATAQTASEGMIDYLDQAGLQTAASRDHSNWVAIQIPNTASANYAQGAKITDVKGVLTDAYNMTFIASANPATDGSETFKANVYVPASFQGTQTSTENGKTYFFAKPKANEYVEVQWAVWDAANNQFTTIPKNAQLNHNMAGLQGTVAVASIANGVTLDDGAVYTLEGIVKASAGSSSGAPRRAAAQETLSLEVMSASKTANDVVTGIADMSGISKTVSGVKYYNLMGAESDRPFEGVNIVVTRFSDGSSQTVKVMK